MNYEPELTFPKEYVSLKHFGKAQSRVVISHDIVMINQ
jgi:hypothetical protein